MTFRIATELRKELINKKNYNIMTKKKKKGGGKTCYIHKNGGMDWRQLNAQTENIKQEGKLADKHRKLHPNK